jgi:hypothetical protein
VRSADQTAGNRRRTTGQQGRTAHDTGRENADRSSALGVLVIVLLGGVSAWRILFDFARWRFLAPEDQATTTSRLATAYYFRCTSITSDAARSSCLQVARLDCRTLLCHRARLSLHSSMVECAIAYADDLPLCRSRCGVSRVGTHFPPLQHSPFPATARPASVRLSTTCAADAGDSHRIPAAFIHHHCHSGIRFLRVHSSSCPPSATIASWSASPLGP